MTDYNFKHELDGLAAAQQNYDTAHAQWEQTETQRQDEYVAAHAAWEQGTAAYEEAHAAWEAEPNDPTGNPLPEPQPPVEPQPPEPMPEPQPPPAPAVYAARELDGPTTVTFSTGDVLVLPPSVVMTAPDGTEYALLPAALAADYVEVTA